MKKPEVNKQVNAYSFILWWTVIALLIACNGRKNVTGLTYTQDGQTLDARIAEDTFVAILRDNRPKNIFQTESLGNQFVFQRLLTKDLAIISLKEAKRYTVDSLVSLGNRFKQQHDSDVALTGYLVYFNKAKTPMIISEEIIVEFKKGTTNVQIDSAFREHNIKVKRPNPFVPGQYLATLSITKPSEILTKTQELAKDRRVRIAQPNYITLVESFSGYPDDPLYPDQWHHHNLGATLRSEDADIDSDSAWLYTTGSNTTIIAVIDEGFDMAHPDISPNFAINTAETANGVDDDGNLFIDDMVGWDFTDCTGLPPLNCGDNTPENQTHGTNSLGTAAAKGNNTTGVIGSCPDCHLLPLEKSAADFGIIMSFDYARSRNAKIVSCSWDFPGDRAIRPQLVIDAIDRCTTNNIAVFFALPNDFSNTCTRPNALSSLPEVISISSSTNTDTYNQTGFGACLDLLAPSYSGDGIGTLGVVTTGEIEIGSCDQLGIQAGYTRCSGGNSTAAPLAAGVAGLVVSANPTITRVQLQNLLQDCADKIDPTAATYLASNGRATSLKHGYGRINAYEAVKIASSSGRGRNGVDIFVRDNALDWGNTEKPSNIKFDSIRGFIGHWNSEDIKTDAPPYQAAPTNNATFESLVNENPKSGVTNKVYVRVRNRGYRKAENVSVKLHWVYAGLALPNLPPDFWTHFPADASDISIWHPLGTMPIPEINYCGASVAGSAADAAQVVAFDFVGPVPDNTLPNHYCLMAIIDSPDDPVIVGDPMLMTRNMDEATSTRNNITHRNYIVEDGPAVMSARFFLYNVYPWAINTRIEIKFSQKLPLIMKDSSFLEGIYLKPGEKRLISFDIDNSKATGPSTISIEQLVIDSLKKKTVRVGGLTYQINKIKTKR